MGPLNSYKKTYIDSQWLMLPLLHVGYFKCWVSLQRRQVLLVVLNKLTVYCSSQGKLLEPETVLRKVKPLPVVLSKLTNHYSSQGKLVELNTVLLKVQPTSYFSVTC
jgi:hypothetical protein